MVLLYTSFLDVDRKLKVYFKLQNIDKKTKKKKK